MANYHPTPLPPFSDEDIRRFWSFVEIRGENDCWPWLGYRSKPYGHGRFNVSNKTSGTAKDWKPVAASRVAFFLEYGADPTPLLILHRCDNGWCSNPNHYFIGTQKDNNQDRTAKGRTASGDRNGSRTCPEAVKRATLKRSRLDPEKASGILAMVDAGHTRETAAKAFGVSTSLAAMICRGERWASFLPKSSQKHRPRLSTRKVSDETISYIYLMRDAGFLQKQIATSLSVSCNVVQYYLRKRMEESS